MPTIIFPTNQAVGSTSSDLGRGGQLDEQDLEELLRAVGGGQSTVISGLSVTTSGLTATIATGRAVIEGHLVIIEETIDVALPSSGTTRVLLQLTRDGDEVTGAIGTTQAHGDGSGAVPADSLALSRVVTSGGSVSNKFDARQWRCGASVSGIYIGDGNATQDVILGETPKLVIVSGLDSELLGISAATAWEARGVATGSTNLFGIYSRPGMSETIETILRASKSWDTGVVAAGGDASTTITVTGAVVGDHVEAWHSDQLNAPSVVLFAEVTSTNQVTVTASNIHASVGGQLDGTLRVALFGRTTTIPAPVRYESGSTSTYRPRIIEGGFRVQNPVDGLNQNTDAYSYVAVM